VALRSVPGHPKFSRLKTLLGATKAHTLGYLEALWHFTGTYAAQGNIGKFSDLEIESWIEWQGEPGELIAALCEAKWVDRDPVHRLIVHDWHEHADAATKKSLGRKKLPFVYPVSYQCPDTGRTEVDLSRQAEAGAGPGAEAEAGPGAAPEAGPARAEVEYVRFREDQHPNAKPSPILDEDWFDFRTVAESVGVTGSSTDWDEAWRFCWRRLDFSQRTAATQGLRDRAGTDDAALKALPLNYLQRRMWERAVRSRAFGGGSGGGHGGGADVIQRAKELAAARRREQQNARG
jgi:hypothetical protein